MACSKRHAQGKVRYLARDDLYSTEKPYSADFAVDERNGAKRSNIITTDCDVQVRPVASRDVFDMNANGFCILNEVTSLTLEDALDRPEEAELKYHAELEQILHKHFPEYTRLEGLDFVVRRRHPHYPSDRVEVVKYEQPAAVAHSDYTPGGAIAQLKGSFPGQEAHFLDKEYDMINVWKPLIGPNNDWPLALCDYSTIQPTDIVQADVLHVDRITENQLLYPNAQHRWYYIENQQETDLIVFRNVDSTGKRAVGFHAALLNPSSEGPPRTSVEVRFVAFR
ncbi:putative CmcJ-like methyltransferase [Ilyonectria sp. MPI-CAGE-AT-0026]|nr:putative CmcJ-like methyltransferase [Ilyonectria sp. MPI-CAGE-AT-0026]